MPNETVNIAGASEQNPVNNRLINTAKITEVFSHLRIPDAIKDVPQFDGNPRLLYDFINNVVSLTTANS